MSAREFMRAWLFAIADAIWPDGATVTPSDEDRACRIWSTAGKL